MTTERKIFIGFAILCLAVFCAAVIVAAFYVHPVAGLFTIALVAWWIGSATAEALKEIRDREERDGR